MTRFTLALVAVSIAVGLHAQQAPVFRGTTDLVTVRVHVVDAKGQPVRDLTPEDFAVKLDGQLRPVRIAAFLGLEAEANSATPEVRKESTNIGESKPVPTLKARTLVLVVDDLSFRFTSTLWRAYRQAIDRWLLELGPADRVALLTTSARRPHVQPTRDLAAIRDALEKIQGTFDIEDGRPQVFVAIQELEAIRKVWLWEDAVREIETSGIYGQVWERECRINPTLCVEPNPPDMFFALKAAASNTLAFAEQQTQKQIRTFNDILTQVGQFKSASEHLVLLMFSEALASRTARSSQDLLKLSHHAAASGASLFLFSGNADESPAAEPDFERLESRYRERIDLNNGIDDLASVTGAVLVRPIGQIGPSLSRVLSETAGIYELGVESPPQVRTSTLRAEVAVKRPGLTVRMNKHVLSLVPPPPPLPIDEQLAQLVRSGGRAYGVPMTVGTSMRRDVSRGGLELGVHLVMEPTSPAPFRIRFAVIDQSGRISNSGQTTSETHHISFGAHIPAGPHRVRIAVADKADAIGAVEHPISGRLTKVGSMFASDLQVATVQPDGTARLLVLDRLPADADRLTVRLELYAPDVSLVVGRTLVRFEIGKAGERKPMSLAEASPTVDDGKLVVSGQMPVAGLPPGAYWLRAIVTEEGGESGRLEVTFAKVQGSGFMVQGAVPSSRVPGTLNPEP